jgi:hypothetical protein
MMSYKTFRWRVHENTAVDMVALLNTLPPARMIEGYAFTGKEIFVTVSRYEPYKKEAEREVAKLQAN